MNKTEIIRTLKDTINEFQDLISSFNEDQLNAVPFKDSWTPAQVARHIIMANAGFGEVLNGSIGKTERAPDQLIERIKADFLNFNIKMTSPDFINPELKPYNKNILLGSLASIKENISEAISILDLTPTCLDFELPVYGHLTRLEAIYFVIYHTQRHAQQLRKIKKYYSSN